MSTQTSVTDKFDRFLQNVYADEVLELANEFPRPRKSLYIDWQDLFTFDDSLAEDFISYPSEMRRHAEEALSEYDVPDGTDLSDAHVRIRNTNNRHAIRALRSEQVNELITLEGVVRNGTDVRPKILSAAFECQRCGTITHIPQRSSKLQEPHDCQGCERSGPFIINHGESDFIDSQAIRLQERPNSLKGGETPKHIDIRYTDDLVGMVTAGDEVEITGILRLEDPSGQEKSTTFDMFVEGIALTPKDTKFEDYSLTADDTEEIKDLSNLPDLYDAMRDSIAPTIYGYPDEKTAIMLQLFGGYPKQLPDGSRIRGDMHILLIGDPGTGKSQLLQYIKNIAPRSVYASGKGSSTAGLTAAAVQSDLGDGMEWTLEAGTLVLADQGIAAIDELDKMDASDRSALHEGLEQQEISVNKAGINATLKSRCSLLAAANPVHGAFDQYEAISEQIDLEPALMSRFDLIFTITDTVNEQQDRKLASHIVDSNYAGELHTKKQRNIDTDSTDSAEEFVQTVDPEVEADLFKKYVAYAKQNCFPEMTDAARNHIEDFYVELRSQGSEEDDPIPITARKLEGMVRLAEASARVRLSNTVTIDDATRATEIIRSSLEDVGIDPETGDFDATMIESGTSKTQRDRIKNIKGIVKELSADSDDGAPIEDVIELAVSTGMSEHQAEEEIEAQKQNAELYEPKQGFLRLT